MRVMPFTPQDTAAAAMRDIVKLDDSLQAYIITRGKQKRQRQIGYGYVYQKAAALGGELRGLGMPSPAIDFAEYGLEALYRKMRVIVWDCEIFSAWSGYEFVSLLDRGLISLEGRRVRLRFAGQEYDREGYIVRLGTTIKYHCLSRKQDGLKGRPLTFKKFDALELI